MSERMTKANLETRCENLNRRMAHRGAIYRYVIGYRYGYTAIDRVRRDTSDTFGMSLPDSVPGKGAGWIMCDTVRAGMTKAEAGEFLHAMMVALDDADYTEDAYAA